MTLSVHHPLAHVGLDCLLAHQEDLKRNTLDGDWENKWMLNFMELDDERDITKESLP